MPPSLLPPLDIPPKLLEMLNSLQEAHDYDDDMAAAAHCSSSQEEPPSLSDMKRTICQIMPVDEDIKDEDITTLVDTKSPLLIGLMSGISSALPRRLMIPLIGNILCDYELTHPQSDA
jgi:hypothetical protein